MRLIFNDGQALTIQSANLVQDGALCIKTISATEDELKRFFEDGFATKKLTIKEREDVVAEYENYTGFEAIVKHTAGILGVILYKVGESPTDKLTDLKEENAQLRDRVSMLEGCILEMSELVYQ